MTNRYFSVENAIKDDIQATSNATEPDKKETVTSSDTTQGEFKESEQFIKKRDYLLNKLLQSPAKINLPEKVCKFWSVLKHWIKK